MSAEPSELIRYVDMQLSYLDDVYELESSCYDFPWTRNILKDCILHEYDFYIALYNKDVVGYIISRITNNESHILNLTVHTDYRNLGIASSLIDMVIRKCNFLLSTMIFLETRTSNKSAINLYQKYDFHRVGIRKNYYKTINGKEDAIIFRKILK
tara:strand:+ start:1958 stop:2422 length:465 start_codon:yes stop_codon:yes gene_type:complete